MLNRIKVDRNVVLLIGLCFALLMAAGLFYFVKEDRRVLVDSLDGPQISEVTRLLQERQVDFDLDTSVGAILVTDADIAAARMVLAESGALESASLGFEIFDNTAYGMTEFSQRIYYQRALQGELENSIRTLDAVRAVRVHLVLPEKSLFKSKNEEAKASVILSTQNLSDMGSEQIVGIQQLIAAAVPQLLAENVTVMDANGTLLSGDAGTGVDISSKLKFKAEVESYYRQKVVNIISKIVDQNSAVVSVNALIDYSKFESTRQAAIPINGNKSGALIRSKIERDYESKPGGKSPNDRASDSETSLVSERLENEYQYTNELTRTEVSPGRINGLSTSVLLTTSIPDTELGYLELLIKQAIGFDEARGDRITVKVISSVLKPEVSGGIPPLVAPENKMKHLTSEETRHEPGDRDYTLKLINTVKNIAGNLPLWVYVFSTVILLGAVVAFYLILAQKRLSHVERLELLEDMKQWLNGDVGAEQNYTK